MSTSPPINPPVLLELDGKTKSVTEQVEFFQQNENKAITERTSIMLKNIDFNESTIRTAAIQFFQVHQQKVCINDVLSTTASSSRSSSAYFEHFIISQLCLSPFLDVFLEKVIRMDLFRAITLLSPSQRRPYVSMRIFDVQCGGFPSHLECLVLNDFYVTELDARYLAGALGNNGNGDGNDGRYHCGLRHLTVRQINFEGNAHNILYDGLRQNKSLREFTEVHPTIMVPSYAQWLLVPLSEHPQLTSVNMKFMFVRSLVAILPSLSLAKNVRVLKMFIIGRGVKDRERTELARHVLRLMTTNPCLSHVCILHRGNSITPTIPELDLRIRHMADLNYAGRSLVMQEERNSSIEQGTTMDRAVAAGASAGVVPLGLWPLVLERSLQRSWPSTAGRASWGDDVYAGWEQTTLSTWRDDIFGGWAPTNTFNGIYHLLIRRGPILQHLLHRDPPDYTGTHPTAKKRCYRIDRVVFR